MGLRVHGSGSTFQTKICELTECVFKEHASGEFSMREKP